MTRLDRHVLIVIGLVVLTAVVTLPRGRAGARVHAAPTAPSVTMPARLGSWTLSSMDPKSVLPVDQRSVESVVRVYENGPRHVWIAVARYTGENGPENRPHVDTVIAVRGVRSLIRSSDTVRRAGGGSLNVARVSVGLPDGSMNAWYWYQLGSRVIGGEYGLRFWLGLNAVVQRPQPLLLIRVATSEPEAPTDVVDALLSHFDRLQTFAEGG